MSYLKDQYSNMIPAQRTFVLSMLVNRIFQNPESYGMNKEGILKVGDKLDFTKLFENIREIKTLFEKAKQTIIGGSPQEKSILENNAKISTWLKEHSKETLSESKVSEILATTPKTATEIISSAPIEKPVEAPPRANPEAGTLHAQIAEDLEKAHARLAELENAKTVAAGGAAMVGAAAVNKIDEYRKERDDYATRRDIAEAQGEGKLAEFEKNEAKNPRVERTLKSDMDKFVREKASQYNSPVENALANDVNKFFAEGLILKTPGIKSKKWKFIRGLSFSKLVKYYTGDSNQSGLNIEAMDELKKSDKYQKFVQYVLWLKDQTDGAVILFEENASIETALRKIGEYLLKNHPVQSKAA